MCRGTSKPNPHETAQDEKRESRPGGGTGGGEGRERGEEVEERDQFPP